MIQRIRKMLPYLTSQRAEEILDLLLPEVLEAPPEIERRHAHDAGFWAGWAQLSERVKEFVKLHRERYDQERIARMLTEDLLRVREAEIRFLRDALRNATVDNDPFRQLSDDPEYLTFREANDAHNS